MPRRRPPFTVDALWAIRRLGTPTLSPDGALACASVTTFDREKNESSTELWLYPTRPGRGAKPRRLTAGDKDSGPAWSPDGRLVAFTAKRKDDEVAQIYVIAPDGGEARRVTKLSTGCASVRWFADGRRVAFISWVWPDLATDAAQAKRQKERKDDKVKVHVTERKVFRYWDHWLTDGREPHVFVCDVETGRCRDVLAGTGLALPPWDPSSNEYDVAPDGREIAITADLAGEPGMLHKTDIVTVDLRTKRKRVLTASTGRSDGAPRYSPDGRVVAYLSHDVDRSHVDQGHLELVARGGGRPRAIGTAFDRAPTHAQWASDGRSILFTAEDRGRTGLWRLSAGAERPALVVRGGTVGGFVQSKDGSTITFDRSSSQHPPALFACDRDGTRERSIESTNAALLAKYAFGETRELTVKGWGGEPVQVWVTYPPDFDPKRRWPLLHSIHGGPHTAHGDGWHFRWNAQVFAAHGYVVPMVNYHGSSGFGQKFLETIVGRYGEKEFADIEAATDALLRAGYVDRTRLVATGGSYGGFMVAYMNGHTGRYASYVCHAGCYDWVSMMATDGYEWFGRELGAWHWEDEKRVLRQSPHHHVGRANTPTLVVHGEQDYRVPATQALQYYDTLKARGVESRLVWFPDENHWILKPQNSLRWYREFFDWVARHAPGGTGRRRPRSG